MKRIYLKVSIIDENRGEIFKRLKEKISKIVKIHIIGLGFPCGSAGKKSSVNVRDLGLIPGLGRSPGEGKGYPLQYSVLENSMDSIVHGVEKSW